ncbi:MAG: transglycosylase domain-containing protein [Eubacterium sp.]|jgi:penicillin-binding protein 1A
MNNTENSTFGSVENISEQQSERSPQSEDETVSSASENDVKESQVSGGETSETAVSRRSAGRHSKRKASDRSDKVKEKTKPTKKKGLVKKIILGIVLGIFSFIFIIGTVACVYIYSIVNNAPEIDPEQMQTLLTETTEIYDQTGAQLDTVFSEGDREIVSLDQISEYMKDAIVDLEDKTFWDHHGFNIVRIFGAIRDAVFSGDEISGTSTITQQLARNLYLPDQKYERTIARKITEAYYAIQIENAMTKEEILETYLNYIYLGYGSYGVQTASRRYFSKDASELTPVEAAALAALPQAPSEYALVEFVDGGTAAEYADVLLKETSDGVFIWNDASKERRETCLYLMKQNGDITQEQYDEAMALTLPEILNPDYEVFNSNSIYFEDYCIEEVISDLQEKYNWDYDTAWSKVYTGGLKIYSTLDPQAQSAVLAGIADTSYYPGISPIYDSSGNIIDKNGNIILYDFDDFFDSNGNFTLPAGEASMLDDGSMQINYGGYLNIYDTTNPDGSSEYSLEFKNFYTYDSSTDDIYIIPGGYINIPAEFKTTDADGNLIISKDFFADETYAGWLTLNSDGTLTIIPAAYSLSAKSIQPQAAMVVIDNATGGIKAMVGGRNTSGRMLYNRATEPHQSGSSIKPLGVYSAALQQSYEEAQAGQKHNFVDYGIDQQGDKFWGDYLTPSSIVIDEKTTIDGKVWPRNANRSYSGVQTMRSALTYSINTCAVKIWYQVGAEYSLQNVKNFGITTLVEEGESNDVNPAALALGGLTYGVTPLEMASAYSVFANNGVRYDTCSYTKVLDSQGNVLLENIPTSHQVLDAGVAWIMGDMLHDVVGYYGNFSGPFAGGKTGSTDDWYDIWFDGFTPTYSAALWIGNDYGMELDRSSYAAAKMWGDIMSNIDAVYNEYDRLDRPDNVIYYNGEYYLEGTNTGIVSTSDLVQKVKICKDSGYLATPLCTNTEEKEFYAYTVTDSEGNKTTKYVAMNDDETAPEYYCYMHNNDVEKYPISPDETLVPWVDPNDSTTDDNTGTTGDGTGTTGDGSDTSSDGSTDSGSTGNTDTGSTGSSNSSTSSGNN